MLSRPNIGLVNTFMKKLMLNQSKIQMAQCLFSVPLGSKLDKICTNEKLSQGTRTQNIETLLYSSHNPSLKRLLADDSISTDEVVEEVFNAEFHANIPRERRTQIYSNLKTCIQQICGYRKLLKQVEALRVTPYSSANQDHEALLLKLWMMLNPTETLTSRISRQWTTIGFQGEDPKTDFRGMGILGLQNLVYFAEIHQDIARDQVIRSTKEQQYGYSFAIVGINMTGMAYELLMTGHLKSHFYNTVLGEPTISNFHQIFAYLLYEFDLYWHAAKPSNIMQFGIVRDKFWDMILRRLHDKTVTVTFNIPDHESTQN